MLALVCAVLGTSWGPATAQQCQGSCPLLVGTLLSQLSESAPASGGSQAGGPDDTHATGASSVGATASHVLLSLILAHRGDLHGAREAARVAKDLDPNNGAAWSALGQAALQAGDLGLAQEALTLAVGRRWQSGRDRDEAVVEDVLALCRVLLRLAGNTANDHDDALPVVAARRERLGSVFDLTTLVLQLAPERGTPSHTAALLLRGDALLGLGDTQAAAAVLQSALYPVPSGTDSPPSLASHPQFVFGGLDAVPPVAPNPVVDTDTRDSESEGPLLIDSFLFNGEIAAEVRLNATAHLFDRVVVVEAWQPFSTARPRKERLYAHTPYWKAVFARFGPKVQVVEVDEFPPMPTSWLVYWLTNIADRNSFSRYKDLSSYVPWWREDALRSAIVGALPQHARYILFVADGDEVVAPSLLRAIRGSPWATYNTLNALGHGYMYLGMRTLVYGLRYRLDEAEELSRAYMATDRVLRAVAGAHGHLATLTTIRSQVSGLRAISEPRWRQEDSGWHLSYLMSPQEIQRKLQSFSHTEYGGPNFTSIEAIKSRMDAGLFPVRVEVPLIPVEPPPDLAAAVGDSLDLYLQGALSLD